MYLERIARRKYKAGEDHHAQKLTRIRSARGSQVETPSLRSEYEINL
jgi:hypothetical protein